MMKNNVKYDESVSKAKENYGDLMKRQDDAIGDDAIDFMQSILTPEEIVESDLRVAIIGEIIKARQEKGLTQKNLEELSGVKQPVIARMETGASIPQLSTILKILVPLGMTLTVVPINRE